GHVTVKAGPHRVAVLNLMGRVFMTPIDCPFRKADEIVPELRKDTSIILVDMHCEATSESQAMGWYLDGRVSPAVATHRHVQTADERVLPGGTAYTTDLAMTGPTEGAIGVVLIGEDPASQVYVRGKKRAADSVGIVTRDALYPQGIGQRELMDLLRALSTDRSVHGILLQLPLPKGLDETVALATIDPDKDIDGLHPTNLGRLLAGEP